MSFDRPCSSQGRVRFLLRAALAVLASAGICPRRSPYRWCDIWLPAGSTRIRKS